MKMEEVPLTSSGEEEEEGGGAPRPQPQPLPGRWQLWAVAAAWILAVLAVYVIVNVNLVTQADRDLAAFHNSLVPATCGTVGFVAFAPWDPHNVCREQSTSAACTDVRRFVVYVRVGVSLGLRFDNQSDTYRVVPLRVMVLADVSGAHDRATYVARGPDRLPFRQLEQPRWRCAYHRERDVVFTAAASRGARFSIMLDQRVLWTNLSLAPVLVVFPLALMCQAACRRRSRSRPRQRRRRFCVACCNVVPVVACYLCLGAAYWFAGGSGGWSRTMLKRFPDCASDAARMMEVDCVDAGHFGDLAQELYLK